MRSSLSISRYARSKLLERSKQPPKAKERVIIETQAVKNVSGLLTLGLVSIIFLAGILAYIFRPELFVDLFKNPASANHSGEHLEQEFRKCRAAARAATSPKSAYRIRPAYAASLAINSRSRTGSA